MAVPQHSKELVAHVVEILREQRESLGVSKKLLAARAGVSRTAIILMEAGKRLPSLELVVKLAVSLDVSFSTIVRNAEKRINRA
ncbi:MAG: helix-turn-helix transcriptional regulator [Verrucomicrobiaceae bacterium]|nr:helix-turn-helix transcriptional regulator [Verrucomicrobiaceae bacterium]